VARAYQQSTTNYLGQAASGSAAHWNIPGSYVTASLWYRSDPAVGANERVLFTKWGTNNANQCWMITNESGGYYLFDTSNGAGGYSYAISKTVPNISVWHHLCGVLSPVEGVSIYVNGMREDRNPVPRSMPSSASGMYVGASGDTDTHVGSGYCSELALWADALSDVEVLALARGLSPLQIRPGMLRGYWPMGMNDGLRDLSKYGVTMSMTGNVPVSKDPDLPTLWTPKLEVPAFPTIGGHLMPTTGLERVAL
jgi:hypothetical protein